jgi:hypothetical protein
MRAAILLMAIGLFCCGPGSDRLTFQAKVSDLRKQGNALANQKQLADSVEITLRGRLLTTPMPVNPIQRSAADSSTPEGAIASILSASTAGDVSWIVETFVPEEREQTIKLLSAPQVVQRTRDYYRNVGRVAMMGWAEVRGFHLVLLRGMDGDGDTTLLTFTLVKTPSGWKQTNALSGDDTYDVVWAAFHGGGVR